MPPHIKLMNSISHHLIDVERRQFEPGTLIYFRDNKSAFIAMSDGKLLDLAQVCGGRLERESALRMEIESLKKRLAVLGDKGAQIRGRIEDVRARARAHVEKALNK